MHWWDRNEDEFLWDSVARKTKTHAITGVTVTRPGSGPGSKQSAQLLTAPSRAEIYTRVIPDLLAVVRQDNDARVIQSALIALGQAIRPPFQDPLLEVLPSLLAKGEPSVQVAAALALGLSTSHEGTQTLISLMSCDSEGHRLVQSPSVSGQLRSAAALALGYGNDPAAVPALIDLIERLSESENEIRTNAVMALGLMDNDASGRAASWLAHKLSDQRLDPAVKSAIPVALARLHRPGAKEVLLSAIQDRDSDRWVVQSSAIGLGRLATMDDEDTLLALARLVEKSKDGPTRRFALLSLARIGAADTATSDNAQAHKDLVRLLSQTVSRPHHQLDQPLAAVAAGLYARGRDEAREILCDRVMAEYDDCNDPETKGAYAISLGLMGVSDAVDLVHDDYVSIKSDGFRRHAAVALGLLNAHESSRELLCQELLREGATPPLRRAVAAALRMLGDQDASGLAAASFGETSSLQSRVSLAVSMGMMRHRESIHTLATATSNDALDDSSRASAAQALGHVVERTSRPWYARLSIDSNMSAPRNTLSALLPLR
ncbi:MAG: HEAT repeat protein [Pseudohongiellaceae bacterium]